MTTQLSSNGGSQTKVVVPTGELPATGTDSSVVLKLAAGGVAAGAGLVVVAARRRRPATA